MDGRVLFLEAIGNALLVGGLLSQTFTYYITYRSSDSVLSTRLFVPALVGLLLCAAALQSGTAYFELSGPSAGRTLGSLSSAWSWLAIPSLLLAEGWLLRRAHQITQSVAVTSLGAALVLSATIMEVLAAAYISRGDLHLVPSWTSAYAFSTCSILLLLNGSSIYCLVQSRKDAISTRVHYVLSALIRNTLFGTVPALLCALGLGVTSLTSNTTHIRTALAAALPTLLGCSVMFFLNARQSIALRSAALTAPLRPLFPHSPPSSERTCHSEPDRRGSLGVLIDRFKLDLPALPPSLVAAPTERRGSRDLEKHPFPSTYRLDYSVARGSIGDDGDSGRRWSGGSSLKSEGLTVGFVV